MDSLKEMQGKLEQLQDELENKQNKLEHMENDPAYYFEDEMIEAYDQMLNEIYSDQFENFLFNLGDPAEWIKENQPIDYRVGFADFSFDPSNCNEYVELSEEIDNLQCEINDLELEIEHLEEEL